MLQSTPHLVLVLGLALGACGSIPEGRFECTSTRDCPAEWYCINRRCFSSLRFDGGGFDAGRSDAGPFDGGTSDAGPRPDASFDAGLPDAGSDAGSIDSGPCVGTLCCGDGACAASEDARSCPQDCPGTCPDGTCNDLRGETACSCPEDCDVQCGNGCCGVFGEVCDCPMDCGAHCGNGFCDCGEAPCDCPADCAVKACHFAAEDFACACVDECCPGLECDGVVPECCVSSGTFCGGNCSTRCCSQQDLDGDQNCD